MSLRFSKKHGVNPCCATCYICGEDTGELILTGKAGEGMARRLGRSDGEMPHKAVFGVKPCDKCKERGIAFVEMTGQHDGAEPTGRRCLVREEAVRRMILEPALSEVLKHRMTYIDRKTADEIGLFAEVTK